MNFMNVGICLCVLLATLSFGSLSFPIKTALSVSEGEPALSDNVAPSSALHARQARSVSQLPLRKTGKYDLSQDTTDARDGLSQLLTSLMSRRGSLYQTRSSLTSRASGPGPSHRIKDRDYLGWMDFGRRSAEEYEYSS